MKPISINKQSRNELNASIILAAMTWSLMMIFAVELIAEIGHLFFSLLPLFPIAVFCLAFYRHHKRTHQTADRTVTSNMGVAIALTAVFICNFSQMKGPSSAMAGYGIFALAMAVLVLLRCRRTR